MADSRAGTPCPQPGPVAVVSVVRIRVGHIITIPEEHYCYGVGPLKMRVTRVEQNPPPGVEWLRVLGVEIRWNGEDGPMRDVLVRVSAFPKVAPRSGCNEE